MSRVSTVKCYYAGLLHSQVFATQNSLMSQEHSLLDESADFLKRIGSEDALRNAWRHLNKSNPDSYGLSGETISDFKKNLESKIPLTSQAILSGMYKFSKTRASLIPKDNGKLRPLQIPEIEDRLVLKSLAIQIEQELNSKLKRSAGVSFAYQKGVGIRDAITKIVEYYEQGFHFVLEADIVNFFDKVEKRRLLQQYIYPNLPTSPVVNKLIEKALSQKLDLSNISDDDKKYFKDIEKGIPQGNPLSPLFSNIYLYSFDEYMINQKYRLVRYADDFIVMLKSQNEAETCFERVKNFLNTELDLDLHPLGTKSKIIHLDKETLSFLSITFDGNKLYPSEQNLIRFKESINTICHANSSNKTILEIIQKVKNALDGWLSSYFFTDIDRYFEEVDSHVNKQVYLALNKKNWKFTNATRGKLKKKFRIGNISPDCLSDIQRKNSGIPFCNSIIKERRQSVIN